MPARPDDPDFKALFEGSPDCYLILDPALNIVGASDAYLSATLTQRDLVLGRPLFEVFPDNPDDPSASGTNNLRASLDRVRQNLLPDVMAIQKYDVPLPGERDRFEERHWAPTNVPILGPGRSLRYILHRVEDVTEHVKLKEQGLEQARISHQLREQVDQAERLRQSQRMEAMGQLAGGIAHDFNNILSAILMAADLALKEDAGPGEGAQALRDIRANSERAAALTRQLLAFSRKQVLQPRPLNLNDVVRELHRMLARLVGDNIKISLRLGEALGSALIDAGQVEQIILNLVLNSRDAMPQGGEIVIETANAELDKGSAAGNPPVEPGPYVMLAVRDSGLGMSAEVQARAFEPFFTTKGVGRGTGLGLATVYGIVTQNRGTLWIYSEARKGTVIKAYLPLIEAESVAEAPAPAPEKSLGGRESILLVEDNPDLREVVYRALVGSGYSLQTCVDGAEALDLLLRDPDRFDLLISDVIMPKLGGAELALKLRHNGSQTKVLFVSGYTASSLPAMSELGTDLHFLEKPFNLRTLLGKVRQTLDSPATRKA